MKSPVSKRCALSTDRGCRHLWELKKEKDHLDGARATPPWEGPNQAHGGHMPPPGLKGPDSGPGQAVRWKLACPADVSSGSGAFLQDTTSVTLSRFSSRSQKLIPRVLCNTRGGSQGPASPLSAFPAVSSGHHGSHLGLQEPGHLCTLGVPLVCAACVVWAGATGRVQGPFTRCRDRRAAGWGH